MQDASPFLEDVFLERKRQDEQWGGPSHDDCHHRNDWITFIRKQLNLADGDASGASVPDADFWERMVKVAALAMAAAESQRRYATAVANYDTHKWKSDRDFLTLEWLCWCDQCGIENNGDPREFWSHQYPPCTPEPEIEEGEIG